mgnify:CR=1 FL=1
MIRFILSLLVFQSQAYGANSTATLTWSEAIDLLKNNNAEFKSADLNYQATEALETSASSGYLPSVSGALGYNQTSTSLNGATDNSSFYSASLTLSQNLFAGLKDYYKTNQKIIKLKNYEKVTLITRHPFRSCCFICSRLYLCKWLHP